MAEQTIVSVSKPAAAPAKSAAYEAYLRRLRRRTWLVQFSQLGLVAAALLLWEIAPRAGWINPMLTSYPSAVFRTLSSMAADGSLITNFFTNNRTPVTA